MNIFNLFKKQADQHAIEEPIISKSIFIDEEKPSSNHFIKETQEATLLNYLKEDHKSKGISDGFEYHSAKALEMSKQKIKTEFRFLLDKSIESLNQKLLDLKMIYVEVKDLSPDLKEKTETSIISNEKSIEELKYQKELSAMDEGWVMKLIYNYELGFIHGANTYVEGEDFLKSIKYI